MNENWYVLYIAIQTVVTPEQAFEAYEFGRLPRNKKCLSREDIKDMKKLYSKGVSYKEIGYMYGISKNGAWIRINKGKDNKK